MALLDPVLLKSRLGLLAGRFDVDALDECDSTNSELMRRAESGAPSGTVIVADRQTAGRGRRGRSWLSAPESSLTFSLLWRFSGPLARLSGLSLAVGVGLASGLESLGAQGVWLKWPNDFYLDRHKIGGVITNIVGEDIVCGIGMNLVSAPEGFGTIDITVLPYNLTKMYCEMFENLPSWKQIFSKYQLEFEHSREFFTHYEEGRMALDEAVLLDDGSLMCKGQRIFSLR